MTAEWIIEARHISKVYANGVQANHDVNFGAGTGEIHALVGENGAGKSTLMKILYGLERPNEGEIWLRGEHVQLTSPLAAIRLGIGMVHQNFMLVPSFSIAENVVLNAEPTRGRFMTDMRTAVARTSELAAQYGLDVRPTARVDSVPVGMRQRAEILKALYRGADIFILDEPTAVLTPRETRELFDAIRRLVDQGKTVIFITHKLGEVKAISDRATVMRDGAVIGTLRTADADERTLARMMVGREVFMNIDAPAATPGKPVLEVRDLGYVTAQGRMALEHITFDVREGEILGVAGVEGNGQTELAEILAGLRHPNHGASEIRVDGRMLAPGNPRRVREARVAYIPEDRLTNGSALDMPIHDNLIIDRYYRPPFTRRGLLRPAAIIDNARRLIAEFGIVTRDRGGAMQAGTLSGGNMQKVILARELSSEPRLLIAAQPTRGVDIGAIEYIHQQLIERRGRGLAILLISADLGEVRKLSDRLMVMHAGRIAATFENPLNVSEEELGLYMTGAKRQG